MKQHLVISLFLCLFLLCGKNIGRAEKTDFPLTEDGAWSVNSNPNAVYYNGKTYAAWVNADKSLVAASFDHTTQAYEEKVVASGFRGDFASPGLLVRENGQILLFSSKNEGEAFVYYWVSKNPEDISEWSASATGTAYGAGGSSPVAVGDDVFVFYRSKNNIGVLCFAGLNASTSQSVSNVSASNTRNGIYGISNGNDYGVKLDIPYMRICQDSNGAVHIVFTQLASGGVNGKYYDYNKSSIHYLKCEIEWSGGIKKAFFKADGSEVSSINAASPPDVIYSEETGNKKAWAYDIALDAEGNPVVLYAAFNPDGTGHTYYCAAWNPAASSWQSTKIADAGIGLPTAAYTANQSKFPQHILSSGGICFANDDLSAVYLSKRQNPAAAAAAEQGTFEIYRYEKTGTAWTEAKAVTSGTEPGIVNIRPVYVKNTPADAPFDMLWMKGSYISPVDFNTGITCQVEITSPTAISFEHEEYEYAVGDTEMLNILFTPALVYDKDVQLTSGSPDIVEITSEGKIKCLAPGTAVITAALASNPAVTAQCRVNVAEESVFRIFMNRIIPDIRKDRMSTVERLDIDAAAYSEALQADGSYTDVNYASKDRTDWPPLAHINRLLTMGLAYTLEESRFYGNDDLKAKMDKMLEYWHTQSPSSSNWYANEIGEPQRMASYLILMDCLGKEKIPEALLTKTINRLRDKGGDPAKQAGANRVDVALHWMYRACLTKDRELLATAMEYIYSPVVYTTGIEGIQYDNSYTQHGRQLHIGSYGEVFMDGITRTAMYGIGTEYALPEEKKEILSKLVKDTYLSVIRGGYIAFSAIGRASTRPGATSKIGGSAIIERMKSIDPDNAAEYENALARIKQEQPASYALLPKSRHYYKTDYTVHQRPAYTVDLRMVSTRTARNEILSDNGEGLKQYFLSDGATGIFIDGDEYYNIFPVWNWAKIPGTTTPEFTTIPKAGTYVKAGESNVVGGVTDSLYSVSVYQYTDTYAGVNSSGNKAWFFFDKEIVCLGNSIKSASEYKVNTTVNQTLLKGGVTISTNGVQAPLAEGAYHYNDNLDWVYHNKTAYYFPEKGKLDLSAQEQSGSWMDINTSYTQAGTVTEKVFSLSFDHGTAPEDEKYSYIIVPGISGVEEAQAYSPSDIDIVKNTDTVQVVYHKQLNIYGIVFHQSGGFSKDGFIVETDAPCVLLVKNADQPTAVVHVADPKNSSTSINIGMKLPRLEEAKGISYQAVSPYLGQSIKFVIDSESPAYTGKNIFYDRSDWTITTSLNGPEDAAVYGDKPEYIIDGDTRSAFLFVKPGKELGGVRGPADYIPSFTIDMKKAQDISFFIYRHRTHNNTTESLRAKAVSLYGKNNESDEFMPVIQNQPIATNVDEVEVRLPKTVNYRYIKLEIADWDKVSSLTIQVSEFYMGYFGSAFIGKPGSNDYAISDGGPNLVLYPNLVKKGETINIKLPAYEDMQLEVFDVAGKLQYTSTKPVIETASLATGMYIVSVQDKTSRKSKTARFIIQ